MYEGRWADDDIDVIGVRSEGEAYAIASGLDVGGVTPVVIIQNTGCLETGDALRGTAYNMGLPIVMLMGYRGYQTLEPGAERIDTAASFFEPTLKAWDIPYTLMDEDGDVGQLIANAFRTASERSLPTAILLVGTTT